MKPWLGITWSISNRFGWGIYGLNLVLELLKRKSPAPVCFGDIATDSMDPDLIERILPAIQFKEQNLKNFYNAGQVKPTWVMPWFLHGLGNGMDWNMISQAVEGDLNVGVIFLNTRTFRQRVRRDCHA